MKRLKKKRIVPQILLLSFITLFGLISGDLWGYQRLETISLAGTWEFAATEPLVELVNDRNGSFDPPQLTPELSAVIPETLRISPEKLMVKDAVWQATKVPGAWEQTAGIDYNGAGWYRRKISISDEWKNENQRIWIEFDAVATAAGVWVNGHWLGGHVGDYARWRVEATAALHSGTNELLVYVDELPGHITQGFLSVVAPHHGGIWQEVRMYSTGNISLLPDGLQIDTDPDNGEVTISAQFDRPWPADWQYPDLQIVKYDPRLKMIPKTLLSDKKAIQILNDTDQNRLIYQVRLQSFERWEPDHPNLYRAIIGISASKIKETFYQNFAFRTIKIDGSTVYLNGRPLNIRSVLNWGYYPRMVSPAPPREVIREEFRYYRSLGFNAETICLMIMPDYFYDIADETGMLIWNEYPTWHNDFSEKDLTAYRQLFPAFFARDRHHPSIVLRSISVEAGVKDQQVMEELVQMGKNMTDTPVQDNSSWFWLSNEKLTDWYGEDNYWNNDRWAQHMLVDLPAILDEMPVKPYIIGETIAGTIWPDIAALLKVKSDNPLGSGLTGTDQRHTGKNWPYWFPTCFESCQEVEKKLRKKYNPLLPAEQDIIKDYLLPQSRDYALAFRKFQISLLYADPRYAGWTLFLGRNVPNCHSGLYDDLGYPRWSPEAWEWLQADPQAPITVQQLEKRDPALPLIRRAPELQQWEDQEIRNQWPVLFLREGYSDPAAILGSWPNARGISEEEIKNLDPRSVLVTTVLTRKTLDFLQVGGRVFLITSRWPGALGGERTMYWAGAVFFPPVSPLSSRMREKLPQLQMFDLTHGKSETIPVQSLGIEWDVDPLIRVLEIHGIPQVQIHDQLFATRVGKGLLMASSLDQTAPAGQWLLGELIGWAESWQPKPQGYPYTDLAVEKLASLAVEKANSIVLLNENWHFKLDPEQVGEISKWYTPIFTDSGWATIQAARLWESQGYSYDGMAWYRKEIEVPEEWTGKKIYLVAEGVDDAYKLWINGKMTARFGSFTEHSETVFQTKTETDLTRYLNLGKPNLIVLQVVDVFGGGGISQPIYLRVE